MKKNLFILVVIAILSLVGCNMNENVNKSGDVQDENQDVFDVKDYEGNWKILSEINGNKENGGRELTIKVKENNTIDFEYSVVSAAPSNRIAQINIDNVKLDDNHMGAFVWEDDGWKNKGKGTIKLNSDKVIINITDTELDEDAMWGIFNGEVVFNKKINDNFKPSVYVIQFDESILGELFEKVGDEVKKCDYEISFNEENKVNIYLNEGNYIEGTYDVNEDKVECQLTSYYGEYSPLQEIDVKIDFKINSKSEIEIINNTQKYTVRATVLGDEGWELTDKLEEKMLWPLVNGIKYIQKV